jgi:hypothetical protein
LVEGASELPLPLLLDSGVLTDQQLNERTQQRFAALAGVVHKLEEPQVEREFLLGNAPMRAQPNAMASVYTILKFHDPGIQ